MPLEGFDQIGDAAAVIVPFAGGATLLSVAVPARTVIGGFDLVVSDLDSNAAPAITLNVGDAADVDRFVAASTIAQGGGRLEYRPASSAWYRYNLASAVTVRVGTDAATDASGTVSLVLFAYQGVDISEAVKQTLQRLGVLAEGETPRAEYANEAEASLREVHERMRGKGIAARQDCAWPVELIPLFAVRSYATMAAWQLCDTFGLPSQRKQLLAAVANEAERELRRQTRKPYSGSPVNLEPYLGRVVTDFGTVLT